MNQTKFSPKLTRMDQNYMIIYHKCDTHLVFPAFSCPNSPFSHRNATAFFVPPASVTDTAPLRSYDRHGTGNRQRPGPVNSVSVELSDCLPWSLGLYIETYGKYGNPLRIVEAYWKYIKQTDFNGFSKCQKYWGTLLLQYSMENNGDVTAVTCGDLT